MKVEVVHTNNPVLTGAVGVVVGYDYVPWCEASQNNPMVEVRFQNGRVESFMLSDLKLAAV